MTLKHEKTKQVTTCYGMCYYDYTPPQNLVLLMPKPCDLPCKTLNLSTFLPIFSFCYLPHQPLLMLASPNHIIVAGLQTFLFMMEKCDMDACVCLQCHGLTLESSRHLSLDT
jgi:hypothetical protein